MRLSTKYYFYFSFFVGLDNNDNHTKHSWQIFSFFFVRLHSQQPTKWYVCSFTGAIVLDISSKKYSFGNKFSGGSVNAKYINNPSSKIARLVSVKYSRPIENLFSIIVYLCLITQPIDKPNHFCLEIDAQRHQEPTPLETIGLPNYILYLFITQWYVRRLSFGQQ